MTEQRRTSILHLREEKMGIEILYPLKPLKMKEAADYFDQFRNMWKIHFRKMDTLLKKLKTKPKKNERK